MSGRDHQRDVRPGLGDFAGQREAVEQFGHLHVREEQDDIGVSRAEQLVRGIAVISLQHLQSRVEYIDRLHRHYELGSVPIASVTAALIHLTSEVFHGKAVLVE